MLSISLALTASALAVTGLLIAEAKQIRWLIGLCKPVASLSFVWLALLAGALQSVYGQWLLAGLIACLLGDLFLISARPKIFLLGLGSFLIGHLLYAMAFLQLGWNGGAVLVSALPALVLAVVVWRWLLPKIEGPMRVPVAAYIIVISGMLSLAGCGWGHPVGFWIIVGAWGFAFSDISVARDRFVNQTFSNRAWGLPLYFASQMILAWSPAVLLAT